MTKLHADTVVPSIFSRALRGSVLTMLGFGGGQFLRLMSNLILTRLLFPEAFGIMALVSVFLIGLGLFSDVGVQTAILQSRRGDDRDFLDTAWTIQAIRGICLWGVASVLAYPMSLFYNEPILMQVLPVSALVLVITGFKPTRVYTANRHLQLGRVTLIELGVQASGVVIAVFLAWLTGSVWALVISGVISALIEVILSMRMLPGQRNRVRLERAAVHELINFGKWVFLATISGFFLSQADKILMGRYLSLDLLGVYNIGFFLASFPALLGNVVVRKVLIPVYREAPPGESRENFAKLQRMRFLATSALMAMITVFASLGVWAVETLYDPRYAMAGAVVVILACATMPQVLAMTYDQAALASGRSREFFYLQATRAILIVACLMTGLELAGFAGALVGQAVAYVLMYPPTVVLARRVQAWDPLHDAVFSIVGLAGAGLALWLNGDTVLALFS